MDFSDNFSDLNIETDYLRLPNLPFIKEDKLKEGLPASADNTEVLRKLCLNQFKKFLEKGWIPTDKKKEYAAQIKLELDTFKELHFTDYVLLIWKIIEKARAEGVFIDKGRGSCVGSLIFYVLEITGIDPIKEGLFFSRFVSKTRSKSKEIDGNIWLDSSLVPDADLNLGEGRPIVLQWLNEIYPNRICKILTMGKLSGKLLIREISKTMLDYTEDQANELSDLIPKVHGVVMSVDKAKDASEKFGKWAAENREAIDVAIQLQDLYKQKGVHASGYLVCHDELTETMPYQLDKEGERISSYTMKYVPAIKVDLLGLTTNTIIRNVLEFSGEDEKKINVTDDPFIYTKFQDGKLLPYGLYQISEDCAYRVCDHVKPVNIGQLSDVNAIARPGSLAYEKDYVNNSGVAPHPLFNDVLKSTRYQPLFQEQTIQLAIKLGFTPEEGELLRRCIGKKLVKEIPQWKVKIEQKCKENNIDPKAGEEFWKLAEASASYSFNKCLSPDTFVETTNGFKQIKNVEIGEFIYAFHNGKKTLDRIKNKFESKATLFEVTLEDGRNIKASMEHKFLTNRGMVKLKEIIDGGLKIIAEDEFFRPVKGYEKEYEISNVGTVRSLKNKTNSICGKIINPNTDQDGYFRLQLSKNGIRKKFYVHRLVADIFLPPNKFNKPTVNHKDGNKKNNSLSNLEWATYTENNQHAFQTGLMTHDHCRGEKCNKSKLTKKDVLKIRKIYKTGRVTQLELGRKYKVSRGAISSIIRYENWKHVK